MNQNLFLWYFLYFVIYVLILILFFMHNAELFFHAKWYIMIINNSALIGRISQTRMNLSDSSYNFIFY